MRAFVGWFLALSVALGLSAYLARAITVGDRRLFLPGDTSSGHHQIEERCELCHSESFSDRETIQASCVDCHATELDEVDDSHPRSKFTDPRNSDRVAILDARYCVTCHREHAPDATGAMGLTLPEDYCFHCHQDVGEERETHVGLPFDGCAASGCHNFHDNRSLYEDFLTRHGNDGDLLEAFRFAVLPSGERTLEALGIARMDAPNGSRWRPSARELSIWSNAIHARGGVNCSGCHAPTDRGEWSLGVPVAVCGECHEPQRAGFAASRHGMRWVAELDAMRPSRARLAMRETAPDGGLDCVSCHGEHVFDLAYAATEACLGCHSDEHSVAFEASPHARFEPAPGTSPEAVEKTGTDRITCATCHLPRVVGPGGRAYVEHNQNHNLRPNEKMIRDVCMDCHGLSFSIDALADRELIRRNFDRSPELHVPSIDWALGRVAPDSNSARRKDRED